MSGMISNGHRRAMYFAPAQAHVENGIPNRGKNTRNAAKKIKSESKE
jgi:hypothetical protein